MSELTSGEKTGIKTVLESARPEQMPVPGAAGQQPSLPLCELQDDESHAELDTGSRGPGRPKGAKNKNTQEWREYLLSRYPSPLIALAETMSRSPKDIAAEMGWAADEIGERRAGAYSRRQGKKDDRENKIERRRGKPDRRIRPFKRRVSHEQLLELFKIQLQCAKELAPYVHQKQPLAVETKGEGLMTLVIQPLAATPSQVEDAGEMGINFIEAETVENQQVSGSENQELDASQLDASGQGFEDTNENQTKQSD